MPTWLSWLSDASAPAWVQAVGSVIIIPVTVWMAAWQRSRSVRDAQVVRARQDTEHLARLATGLKAEISAAIESMEVQQSTIEQTLKLLDAARAKGAVIKTDPVQSGSVVVTDAIIYRQIAAELGRFPPDLIKSVVQFYAGTLLMGRIADSAPTAQLTLEATQGLAPRLKILAALLIKKLDNFEASGFAADAKIGPKPADVRAIAAKLGYPLDQILRERGLQQ
jgi:hypothetical protein